MDSDKGTAPPPPSQKTRRLSYEHRVLLLAILAGLPGTVVSLIILWSGEYTAKVQWTLTVLIAGCWWGFIYALRERLVFPLQTLANLIEALREEDYSLRARSTRQGDALGEVMQEVNALAESLKEQRLDALEATALLRKVMGEIEVAVFTFDAEQRLQLVNRAGEKLLAKPAERLLGRQADELGLADCLEGKGARVLHRSFPGGMGRWGLRRSTFRENGLPHHLVVLTDLSRALREEERQAWQRLIRVLGHELNNSLTPIKSMAATLKAIVSRGRGSQDFQEDMSRGLEIITERSEALSRFMAAYSQLARVPEPSFRALEVDAWVRRVAELDSRLGIEVVKGPPVVIQADGDQLDQLLINLIRNGVDAALETGGGVRVGWRKAGAQLEVWVEDEGPGLSNTANLFVPFFTTKTRGTGIGLVLSLQIAEAHGGSLVLDNRRGGQGCRAVLTLPISSPS